MSAASPTVPLRSGGTLGQGAACTACPRVAGHSPQQGSPGTAGCRRERAQTGSLGLRNEGDSWWLDAAREGRQAAGVW